MTAGAPRERPGRWDGSLRSWFERKVRGEKDARAFLLRLVPQGGACAEIGVWKGAFSAKILERTRPRRLWLIDPWTFAGEQPGRCFGGLRAQSQADMDAIHDDVARRLGARPEVTILRATSAGAAASIEDRSLDWVYVDGDHSYEAVKLDLALYAPKLRAGGFLTGDDYDFEEDGALPVKRAVDEFAASGAARVVTIRNGQFVLRVP